MKSKKIKTGNQVGILIWGFFNLGIFFQIKYVTDSGSLDYYLHHVQICAQLDNLRSFGDQFQSFQRSSD